MHFIGPSFSNCVSYFWENFHGHWLDTFCSLNKIETLLVFFMFLFLKMLCSYLIWSCFLPLLMIIVFYHIFPLFTHCCLTTQKNKKIGTIISIFQKYFWGYAGVWLECEMNDWLTLIMMMFGWYWFSLCAQPKTKKEIFSMFTTRHAWWQK